MMSVFKQNVITVYFEMMINKSLWFSYYMIINKLIIFFDSEIAKIISRQTNKFFPYIKSIHKSVSLTQVTSSLLDTIHASKVWLSSEITMLSTEDCGTHFKSMMELHRIHWIDVCLSKNCRWNCLYLWLLQCSQCQILRLTSNSKMELHHIHWIDVCL